MSEKSDEHGFRLGDQLRRETEGFVRGGSTGDEPEPGRDPAAAGSTRMRGARPGMTPRDVEGRSTFAKLLAGAHYPLTPDRLSTHVPEERAPDIRALGDLPRRPYTGLPDVRDGLGYVRETGRF